MGGWGERRGREGAAGGAGIEGQKVRGGGGRGREEGAARWCPR
jgi:hypothetical protein